MSERWRVTQVVSGGQTGVDRAALDVAIELEIPHGGWCPRGRLAEDGTIAAHYQLREMTVAEYAARTERNVLDSDGTLILHVGQIGGGTELTFKLALRHRRPVLVVDLAGGAADVGPVERWLALHQIHVLNVAGPRESTTPGIYDWAKDFLRQLLTPADH